MRSVVGGDQRYSFLLSRLHCCALLDPNLNIILTLTTQLTLESATARSQNAPRCIARGVGCSYTAEEDGRRPASKTYVQLLRRRIDHLERLLLLQGDASSLTAPERPRYNNENLPETPDPYDDLLSSEYADICVSFEGALCLNESLNFDGDDQPRYFGATSGRLEFESRMSSGYSGSLLWKLTNVMHSCS